jgi:hypothetical protein
MRFIDCDEIDMRLMRERYESRIGKALWRDVQQFERACKRSIDDIALCGRTELGVQVRGGNTRFTQDANLIIHERNEGADYHCNARLHEGGHLIANRFSGTCGHDTECIAFLEYRIDKFALTRAEIIVTEVFP